jgi:hypothetical protein
MSLMTADAARLDLNQRISNGLIHHRRVKQGMGTLFAGATFRCFESGTGNVAVEVYEDNRPRLVGCPNPPRYYLLARRGSDTYYRIWDYGRFLKLAQRWLAA